jgi:hypothetical protein
MTKKEAYQHLAAEIKTINDLIHEANKFASANGLTMGTLRTSPGYWEAGKPKEVLEEERKAAEEEYETSEYYDSDYEGADGWISSQVCW